MFASQFGIYLHLQVKPCRYGHDSTGFVKHWPFVHFFRLKRNEHDWIRDPQNNVGHTLMQICWPTAYIFTNLTVEHQVKFQMSMCWNGQFYVRLKKICNCSYRNASFELSKKKKKNVIPFEFWLFEYFIGIKTLTMGVAPHHMPYVSI